LGVGVGCPLPSCPSSFAPQQCTAPLRASEHDVRSPAVTEAASGIETTACGVDDDIDIPVPS
jgi:hypothetical protein